MSEYLARHLQACLFALGQLSRQRVNTLLSAAVIAVSLALPAGFLLLLEALDDLAGGWSGTPRLSVYLEVGLPQEQMEAVAAQLRRRADVAHVEAISSDQALTEFKAVSGFGGVLDLLDENPLPAVILVRPSAAAQTQAALEAMQQSLAALPGVAEAQFDLAWLRRLGAILAVGQRAAQLLTLLLGAGVILIVGNTIRLAIFNRRDEIEVSKLVGATDGFIRRPFLYSGLQQGLLGGLLAVLVIYIGLWLLASPLRELAALYDDLALAPHFSARAALVLILFGGLLGWGGAWLAVGRHLREIEPT